MTLGFKGTPKFYGMGGDHARVARFEGRVLIHAIDPLADEAATIAMTPKQARALAQGIIEAANVSEAEASE